MHSVLIEPVVVGVIKKRLGRYALYYRLIYNLLSAVSLLPLIFLTSVDKGEVIFSWTGPVAFFRFVCIVLALVCFLEGARGYDLQNFLGVKQIREGEDTLLLSEDGSFSEFGVFALVRHPWYVGSFLFVWSIFTTYHEKSFAVASILSVYLIVGTYLEERKILAKHGEMYRRYKERVSMFIPLKWLARKIF
jgi:protein-S-isoprenylcysteine O-methyltransferase Ste14